METAVAEYERSGRVHRWVSGLSGFSLLGMLVLGVFLSFLGFSEDSLGFEVGYSGRLMLGILLMGYVLLVVAVVSVVVYVMTSLFGGRSYGIGYVRVLRAGVFIGSVSLLSTYVFWFGVLNLDNWSYLYLSMVSLLLMGVMWSSLVYERGLSYLSELRKSGYVLSDEEFRDRFGSGDAEEFVEELDAEGIGSGKSEAELRGYDVDEHGFILPTDRNRNLKLAERRGESRSEVETEAEEDSD